METVGSICVVFSEGDADLFVSDIHAEPTYDFDNHELTSGTCGLDVVYLTKDLQRPINIAVYGNPRYEVRNVRKKGGLLFVTPHSCRKATSVLK
jgi:hypothetical protein